MTFWKKMPYWLRGGIVGGGLAFMFVPLAFVVCPFMTSEDIWCPVVAYLPLIPFLPLIDNSEIVRSFLQGIGIESTLGSLVIPVLLWFIIGSLLGALADFLKYKENKKRASDDAEAL